MKRILLAVFSVLLTITSYQLSANKVYAAQDFKTSYDVTYDVGEDGQTFVTEKITLKNLTSQYYATQFKLTIGATNITDVKASDPSGPLEVKTEAKDNSTIVSMKFNQQVVGVGKQLSWTLSFKSIDFAQHLGRVWDITLPKITDNDIDRYDLILSVPSSFGDPTGISPNPKKQNTSFGKSFYTFSKEQLESAGVSASFGTFQIFDFDLTYNLENNQLFPILTNIALPPDTPYQDVIFNQIEPKPLNVTVDNDGNYLAWYRLNRGQKIMVQAAGSAKLYPNSKVKTPSLDQTLKDEYLVPLKYWEKDNPIIKAKLTEILGSNPPSKSSDKARLIHRWVATNLKYDSSKINSSSIERLGAVTVLSNPSSAVCMEFTDLFIALARAAGIPARELDGFAYTNNPNLRPLSLSKDILHAWPEYWDENKGWVMIDPTWENTTSGVDYFNKFDLNHFVFAIKGISSQTPVSAGSYKFGKTSDSKDVKVTLSDQNFIGKPQLNLSFSVSDPIIAGFPDKLKIMVTNLGNSYQPSSKLSVLAGILTILDGDKNLGSIPAFGYSEFEFNIRTKSLFDSYNDVIEVAIAGQKFTKDVRVSPFLQSKWFPFTIGLVLGLPLMVYLTTLGVFVYRRRFKTKK